MSIRRACRPSPPITLWDKNLASSSPDQISEDDLKINNELSDCQQHEIREVLTQFKDLFSEIPGRAKDVEIEIRTRDNPPVYQHTMFHYTNTR